MMPVGPLLPIGTFFDTETSEAVTVAFDKACALLECGDDAALGKVTIAMHIGFIAGTGERDPKRMVAATVLALDALTEMQVAAIPDFVPFRVPARSPVVLPTYGYGFDPQRSAIASLVEHGGSELLQVFTQIESGSKDGRAIFWRAAEVAAKKRATLVVSKLNRLSRSGIRFIVDLRRLPILGRRRGA